MTRIRITMMATTSRMWMNPPKVYEVTRPSSHKIRRITASVQSKSMGELLFLFREVGSGSRAGSSATFVIGRRLNAEGSAGHPGKRVIRRAVRGTDRGYQL